MEISKNKLNIIIVIAMIVICGGSFLGVRAMSNKIDTDTTVPTSYQASTTVPTTTAPLTTVPTTTQPPVISDATTTLIPESVITTFAIGTTVPTTTQPTTETTTRETTTRETTTRETTTRETTTKETTTKASTTKVNTQSGTQNGSNAIFDEGLASYQYDTEGNYYFTNSDPWQRALGYHEVFDVGAGFVAIYMDTMRCKFEYGNKDWMIQFWKGQYGFVFVGHEIGVYTKPKDRTNDHYDAASNEDALYMELTGYRDGEELYHRDYGKYWWCTGFVPGTLDKLTDRSELSLDCRITMKDYKMLLAFCASLKENGLVLDEDYSTSGLDVFVTW